MTTCGNFAVCAKAPAAKDDADFLAVWSDLQDEQRWWLRQICDCVAIGVGITVEDLHGVPFTERGGQAGLVRDFGGRVRARAVVVELDRELA